METTLLDNVKPNENPVGATPLNGSSPDVQALPVDTPQDVAPTTLFPRTERARMQRGAAVAAPEASLGEVLKANVQDWAITRTGKYLHDALTNEKVDPTKADPNFNLSDYMANSKIVTTTAERDWLRSKNIASKDEADQYYQMLTDRRERQQITAQMPKTSFATQVFDPLFLLTGGAALTTARVLNMSRKAAMVAGAAYEGGAVRVDEITRPTEMSDYVLAAMLGGVANGIVHKPVPRAEYISPFTLDGIKNMSPIGRHRVEAQINHAIKLDAENMASNIAHAKFEVQSIANTNREFIDIPKFEVTNIGGELTYVRAKNTITDTFKGAQDVPPIRTETLNLAKTHGWFAPREVAKDAPAATALLNRVVNNTAVPEVLRSIAAQLLGWGGKQFDSISTKFNSRGIGRNTAGVYKHNTHSIDVKAGRNTFDKGSKGTVRTFLHEAMHGITSIKYNWGKANPDSVHGRIVKEMDSLFYAAKAAANKSGLSSQPHAVRYGFTNPKEFMAVMMEGDANFYKFLETLELPAGTLSSTHKPSLVGDMYDAMRRLMGLDLEQSNALTRGLELSEQLAKTPATYTIDLKADGRVTRRQIKDNQTMETIEKRTLDEVSDMAAESPQAQTLMQKAGNKLAWNLFKTMQKIHPETATKWLSDPLNSNAGNNIVSSRRAIRAELADLELNYHVALRQAMADEGVKWWEYVLRPAKTREVQDKLHREIMDVLLEWENKGTRGNTRMGENKAVYNAAVAFDDTMRAAGKTGVDAGLFKQGLTAEHGYIPRRMSATRLENIERQLTNFFKGDEAAARKYLAQQYAHSFRGMDNLTPEDALNVATAVLDRTRRQGELQDLTFRGHMGLEVLAEVRDMMTRQGAKSKDIQRVMDVLEGKVAEAGKASYQKSRLDINMTHELQMPDGSTVQLRELLDHNITSLMGNYLDDISGRAAMSEFGIKNSADIDKARQEFVRHAKGDKARREANDLFEALVNDVLGRPVGEQLADGLRYVQAATTMMSLRNSGFWQVTEFAKMFQRYGSLVGFGTTVKHVFGSFTGMAKTLEKPENAKSLQGILSRNSYNELRLRPFIDKLDDGYMIENNAFLSGAKHAQQYVYVANMMTYFQRRQSVAAANLVVDTLERATKGDAKAADFFKRYNLDADALGSVGEQFRKHGYNVDKWDEGVWARVRSPLQTIMDEDVLRARTGEIPAIAQFSSVGKVLFTFRNFTLSSHNKILANGLVNDGGKAMALFFAYQLALSSVMVQVANASKEGELITDKSEWANRAVSMMGGLGLLAEGVGIFTGSSRQFGSPFLMSVDKVYRAGNFLGGGEFNKAAMTTADSIPLVSLVPAWGAAVRAVFGEN